MRIERLHVGDIESRPDENPRKTVRGIAALADSIEELGLLENLVVAPKRGGGYALKAGERRYRALCLLESEKRHDGYAHCLVIESDGEFEALAENEGRQGVLPWETGDRYNELTDRGFTQEDIARKIGVPRTRVSQYQRIARGLAVKVRDILAKMPSALTMQQLEMLSSLVDQDGVPDEKMQIRKLDDFLSAPGRRKKRKARNLGELPMRERLFVRYKSLKYQVSVPIEARAHVDAVLNFMDGTDKHLNLRAWGIEKL